MQFHKLYIFVIDIELYVNLHSQINLLFSSEFNTILDKIPIHTIVNNFLYKHHVSII